MEEDRLTDFGGDKGAQVPDLGPSARLTWRVHEQGSAIVFRAWGEIDLVEVPRFQEALLTWVGSVLPDTPIILDLRGVTYFELRALETLEHASARAPGLIIIPSRVVRRLIELLGLEKTLTLKDSPAFGDQVEAVQSP